MLQIGRFYAFYLVGSVIPFLRIKDFRDVLKSGLENNDKMKETLSYGNLNNYFTTELYIKMFLEEEIKIKDIYLSKLSYKFLIDF